MQQHTIQKPKPINTDSRGTKIEPGLRIAYNRSGYVKIGKIRKITVNKWKKTRAGVSPKSWWFAQFEMIVENENGYLSKVRNPDAFVVI